VAALDLTAYGFCCGMLSDATLAMSS